MESELPKGVVVSAEELERAATNLIEGKNLIDDDPDKAVELLCSVVRTYEKHYGSDALQCADVYLYYGIALYEVARNATDALGGAKTTVDKSAMAADPAGPSGSGAGGSAAAGKPPAAAEAEASAAEREAAAGTATEGAEEENEEGGADGGEEGGDAEERGADGEEGGDGDGEEGANGEGEDGEGSPSDDMKLAWELIEMSRVIYSKHSPEEHHSKLAEVHKSLGDIKGEQEHFDEAVECYKQSVVHLRAMQPPSVRRLAEVQYKLALMLTFLELPNEALELTLETLTSLEAAVAELEEKLVALPTDGSGGEATEEEGRRLQAAADDLRDIMAELTHNCEGLRETIANDKSLKEVLRQAFIKANGGVAPSASAAGGSSSSFAAPSNPASTSAAVSLGVVGRGTKRITLQATAAAPTQEQQQASGAAGGVLGSGAAGQAPPKRTLADLMGAQPGAAAGGIAFSGFGASVVGATAAGTGDGQVQVQVQEPAKRARVEEVAAAPVETGSGEAAK